MPTNQLRKKPARVERKKVPDPGVEIISKILASPNKHRLVLYMMDGLANVNYPPARKYVNEYWSRLNELEAAFDREKITPLKRSK